MIKNYLVTGDTHGQVLERLSKLSKTEYKPTETAIIILGDAGINFYLNSSDKKNKINIQKSGYTILCVHGNHEERPENLGMILRDYDKNNIKGKFYWEDQYPNILYFDNFGLYQINGYNIYVIGGAYSVDKYYRILRSPHPERWSDWFEDEQLSDEEMLECQVDILNLPIDLEIDFVFTHTCPIQWEPTDLFLNGINQSSVDKSMELWLEEVEKDLQPYKIWLFGHYHADRLERPHVQQMYYTIESLDEIYNRWYGDNPTINEEYWLRKAPYYYERP